MGACGVANGSSSSRAAIAEAGRSAGRLRHQLRYDARELRRDRRIHIRERRGIERPLSANLVLRRSSWKWRRAAEREVKRAAERIEIGLRPDIGRVPRLLGGDVIHRAENVALAADESRIVWQRFVKCQRKPEVENLRGAGRRNHHVRGLEIAMNDPVLVEMMKSCRNIREDARRVANTDATAEAHEPLQASTGNVFQREEVDAVEFATRERTRDIRMIGFPAHLDLAAKPVEHSFLFARDSRRQNLQCNEHFVPEFLR